MVIRVQTEIKFEPLWKAISLTKLEGHTQNTSKYQSKLVVMGAINPRPHCFEKSFRMISSNADAWLTYLTRAMTSIESWALHKDSMG
jgi:hypothetical protein